jgi:hypothetical protein
MSKFDRRKKLIALQHDRDMIEGRLDYGEMSYRDELTSTENTKSGGEYQTSIIYDSKGKMIGTATLFKKHVAPVVTDPSIDAFIEAEMIAERYGLNEFLPENMRGIALIAKSGAYDLGNTGRGDIPLPGPINREFVLGRRPAYNKSLRDIN